jgi:L-ribulose-5-phosphate 3-epimerase
MRLSTRMAVVLRCFGQPLKKALQTAGTMNVTGIQLDAITELRSLELSDSGRRQFLRHLSDQGLSIASVNVPLQKSLSELTDLDARIDLLKRAMQSAFLLKSKIVTARIGRIPENTESREYNTLVAVLNDLAKHANHVGSVLAVTPSGDPLQAIDDLFSKISQGPMELHLDPAGLVASGQQAAEFFRRFPKIISQIQIRDAVRDLDGGVLETPVGRGEVVWDELMVLIHEADFKGWLAVERKQGEDKFGDMSRALSFTKQLLPS